RAKQELETLQNRLHSWQGTVSQRARRFHEVRSELEDQVRKNLSSWRLWIPPDELKRLQDRTDRLDPISKTLAALIPQAEQLEDEVHQIERRAEEGGDPEFGPWLKRRCREWLIALQSIGTDSDRPADVSRDQNVLAETEDEVRLHDQALNWLREAERVLVILGTDLQAAHLRADLPELKSRLYSSGASADWLQQIRSQVQPLQPIASRIKDPPQELQTASTLLTDLRGWSQQLGEMEEQVVNLEQRRHFIAVDWTQAQIDDLNTEAKQLRDHLVQKARDQRDRQIAELTEQMDDMIEACGPQPALQQRLTDLKARSFDRYQIFRDWLSQFDQVRNFFLAIANNNEGSLETRRDDLAQKLRMRLEQVRKLPLSDDVKHKAEALDHDLRRLEKAFGAEELLLALRHRRELEDQIGEITGQAAREMEELSRQLQTIRQQNGELRQLAAEVGVATPDLEQRIAGLDGPEASSLEEARRRSNELTAEMEEIREQFVGRCRKLFDDQLAAIQRSVDVLRQANHPFSISELPIFAPAAGPRESAQAVSASMTLNQQVAQVVKRANAEVEERRRLAEENLARIPLSTLGPEERELAEQLREELASGSWSRARKPLTRLELGSQLVEKCDLFFARLLQEERTARERLDSLRRRLQRFTESQLRHFCPELTDRVTALVYGIPDKPRQWRAVHRQLDIAESLFARVQVQAKRLAAAELDQAVELIEGRLRSSNDAGFRAMAQTLLAEIEAWGQQELPPVNLRLRALDATAQRDPGGLS